MPSLLFDRPCSPASVVLLVSACLSANAARGCGSTLEAFLSCLTAAWLLAMSIVLTVRLCCLECCARDAGWPPSCGKGGSRAGEGLACPPSAARRPGREQCPCSDSLRHPCLLWDGEGGASPRRPVGRQKQQPSSRVDGARHRSAALPSTLPRLDPNSEAQSRPLMCCPGLPLPRCLAWRRTTQGCPARAGARPAGAADGAVLLHHAAQRRAALRGCVAAGCTLLRCRRTLCALPSCSPHTPLSTPPYLGLAGRLPGPPPASWASTPSSPRPSAAAAAGGGGGTAGTTSRRDGRLTVPPAAACPARPTAANT